MKKPKDTDCHFIIKSDVHHAQTGEKFPEGWTGVASRQSEGHTTFFYLGIEGAERTWNGLYATNYADALEEAREKFLIPPFVQAVKEANDTGTAYLRATDNDGIDPDTRMTKKQLSVLSDKQAAKAKLLKSIANGVEYPTPELMVKVGEQGGYYGWKLDSDGIIAYGNSRLECLINFADSFYGEYGNEYAESRCRAKPLDAPAEEPTLAPK